MTPPSSADDLPAVLPVFPLAGSVLLPRMVLPLNIFEPRYLAMVRDAMAAERLIGIIQPKDEAEPPALFGVGGVGRITQFSETGDGRYLIALGGLTRFRVVQELPATTPYRQVRADYAPFVGDWGTPPPLDATSRASLEGTLRTFLDAQGLSADWEAVAGADDENLVNTLAAVCPFEPVERQAMLEAADLAERAQTLTALMTFGAGPESGLQ